ncbi:HD-GYP domain-containing protein [Amedibacillus sp. YH-ame6]
MGLKVWHDQNLYNTTDAVSVECLKDDKMQVVFYTLFNKECLNIVPDDYQVTSIILVLEGHVKLYSVNEHYELEAHDSVMLTDISQSYVIEANGFAKIIAISNEVNQSPEEDELLNKMLVTVEEKDTYTKGHSKRVSLYSIRLALAYESTYNVVSLGVAASMHDIGKINVPISILRKPDKLTDEEYDIIKLHPLDSYTFLKDKLGERVAQAALQHHERLDGSGYPYGIRAEHICMDARIIAIADVFDAMTCKRTYNEPRKAIEVVEYLEQNLDKYDAVIIAILRRKVESGELDDIVTAFTTTLSTNI